MTTTTMPVETDRGNLPAYLAILAGGALLLHAVLVIGSEDGLDTAAVILFFGGNLLALAAAITTGLRARRGWRALTAIGLSVLVIAWVMGLGDLTEPLFEAFKDEDYVGDAGPLGILGAALLALGIGQRARS
jgi:hypothetical protein